MVCKTKWNEIALPCTLFSTHKRSSIHTPGDTPHTMRERELPLIITIYYTCLISVVSLFFLLWTALHESVRLSSSHSCSPNPWNWAASMCFCIEWRIKKIWFFLTLCANAARLRIPQAVGISRILPLEKLGLIPKNMSFIITTAHKFFNSTRRRNEQLRPMKWKSNILCL